MPQVIDQPPAELVNRPSPDVQLVLSVSVVTTAAAGSSDIPFFIVPSNDEPFVLGEDHPALVSAWDNDDDAIFDEL
jgi:hypothetical protein